VLKKQIDGILNKGFGIHQIVLDNPSWAFQRDSLGNFENDSLKVETYGNAEPPSDFNAWGNYLKEVMTFLIDTYGKDEVLKIQFGIGREIGTKGHWTGTNVKFRSAVYNTNNGTLPWSSWQISSTKGEQADKSTIGFKHELPAFSFLKYEYYIID